MAISTTRVAWITAAVGLLALAVLALALDWARPEPATRALWRQAVLPGPLSASHAFIGDHCAACHVPIQGVQALQCAACHADNTALLQRPPTAFHAQAPRCTGCHLEHQGGARMPTTMDHALLARVGHARLEQAVRAAPDAQAARVVSELPWPPRASRAPATAPAGWQVDPQALAQRLPARHPPIAAERALSCVACHGTQDRHQRMFGADCAACHATTQWPVAAYRHPSPRSMDCAQCHRPPPSHLMMHFEMVSIPVARQPGARVNQCYLCHQTTAWNDIKGRGFYKHH